MAPSEQEEKMQAACDKKETALTKLQQWLNGVASIISTKSDKDTATTNLTHLNESFEDYKIAYMEFLALMEDEDEMDKIKAHYDEMKDKVEQARTDLGNYLHQFDREKVDHESASQKSSKISNTSSVLRAQAAAKKAALLARQKMLDERHKLEKEEQELRIRKERLELETDLAVASAEEQAILSLESGTDRDSEVLTKDKVDVTKSVGIKGDQTTVPNPADKVSVMDSEKEIAPQAEGKTTGIDIYQQQRQLIDILEAPKLEIPSFNGDPLKYYVFIRAFEINVDKKINCNTSKLLRLIQYCTGPALTLVQGCAIMESDEGYATARDLLKERFGNPVIIAQAWCDHITAGQSNIKPNDGPALQQYADLLRTCLHTLKAMNALGEISAQSTLRDIISKLPAYLTSRWRREVVRVRHSFRRLPSFEDLVVYVERAAEEANVPIFGSVAGRVESREQQPDNRQKPARRHTSFHTSASSDNTSSEASKKCQVCSNDHMIWECKSFKEMSHDERFDLVKKERLCFNCLKRGSHGSKECKSPRRCNIDNCGRKHSYLLHSSKNQTHSSTSRTAAPNDTSNVQSSRAPSTTNAFADTNSLLGDDTYALPAVHVKVYSPLGHKEVQCYAMLDTCSTHSYVSKSLKEELGLVGRNGTVSLTTLEKQDSESSAEVVQQLEVSDITGTNFVKIPYTIIRNDLPINPENIANYQDVSGLAHLQGIDLPQTTSKDVKLIIGQNCMKAIFPLDAIRGDWDQPWASRHYLGWALNGPVSKGKARSSSNKVMTHFLAVKGDDSLSQQVERFWEIESSGLYEEDVGMSVNDNEVMRRWDKTTKKKDGHYEVQIPFKQENERLPNNRPMAEKRQKQLELKLEKKPELKKQYKEAIDDLIEKGHAKEVPNEVINRSDGNVWYLPHFCVINPNKPKIRVVFDAAAKFGNYSLNDKVLQGPDLTNKLIGVLIRFRLRKFCIMADIKAMFYQVLVPEEQQDVLRFIWGGKEYCLTRHVFGGTWSPSAANYALHKTIADHGQDFSPITREAAMKGFYVDDLLLSVDSKEEAAQLCKELKALLALGGFNLTKWLSNDKEAIEEVPEDDRSEKQQHTFEEPLAERALGVTWDLTNDTFGYNIKMKEKPPTKRGVLSTLSSVYDPLGVAGPTILKARLIIQELFRLKVGWDERLPPEQLEMWERWLAELPYMGGFKVQRCVKPENGKIVSRELHHFSDASEAAYGVCTYVRQVDEEGVITVRLLMAKSRLAPLKQITIPRLELIAATLAVKQNEMIIKEIDEEIDQIHFWTDSMIVLKYIQNENRRFKTFVANRLAVIKEASNSEQWHHVESHNNPADIASRGASAKELSKSTLWTNGPHFLSKHWREWTKTEAVDDLEEDDPELKREVKVFTVEVKEASPSDKLMTAFSSWPKLKTAVSWMLILKKVLLHQDEGIPHLEAQHIKEGEHAILQHVQRKAFDEDILASGVIAKSSPLVKLQPKMMNGLLCVGGRLKQSPHLNEESKHPVILPGNSPVVVLMMRHIHERHGHAGREYVLAEARRTYWIIRGRSCIRNVLRGCMTCRKREPVACQQQMADLPPDRVSAGGVFRQIGIDMYGPIMVKRGRAQAKRYGCLFTCLATRAVHVEIAHSLDTDSFIQCLQRFVSRRGRPRMIRCDQGRNFIGAERELREELEALNDKTVQDFMNQEGIEWKFNPPYASMAGGVWERMIRSIRRVIAGISTQQVLTDEGLLTITAMAESIVNNRPITPNSADANDLNALSPSHFLIMQPVEDIPGRFDQDCLRKHWRQLQYLSNVLWKRWIREYLPQLHQRTKWLLEKRNLHVGDLVLIMDYSVPKNQWNMGRVLAVNMGSDNKVRSVQVKMPNTVVTRPISKVSLLEANEVETGKDVNVSLPSEE